MVLLSCLLWLVFLFSDLAQQPEKLSLSQVFPNSPAAHSGLIPYKDYMLGTADMAFREILLGASKLLQLTN